MTMTIKDKWKKYLLATIYKTSLCFQHFEDKILEDWQILLILGVTNNATIRNYINEGKLAGKRVRDILDYLVRFDNVLIDPKIKNKIALDELKEEFKYLYQKGAKNV